MEMIKYRIALPSVPPHPSFSACLITFPLPSALSYHLLPETATLQFHFTCGNVSSSVPPPVQPCMNSFLGFSRSHFTCLPLPTSHHLFLSLFPFLLLFLPIPQLFLRTILPSCWSSNDSVLLSITEMISY